MYNINNRQSMYKIPKGLESHLGDYSQESSSSKYLKKMPPKQDIKYNLFN